MQLTSENLYHYLALKGLIDTETVINGNYMVQELPTRTRIKKVLMQPARSLFIKQPPQDQIAADILKREYEAYNLLSQSGMFPEMRGRLPQLVHYNENHNILITELMPDSVNLQEFYIKNKSFPLSVAAQQAEVLAAYQHALPAHADTSAFPKILPWVLQLHLHDAAAFFPGNPENAKLIGIIKDNVFMTNTIKTLASQWKQTHFIHGDIKWVNFLVINSADSIHLNLIDWELADVGDPLWDAAGLLQSYISTWVFGFDNNNPSMHNFSENFSSFHISAMRESAAVYLQRYMQLTNAHGLTEHQALIKIMQYTALRIIQTSIEGVEFEHAIKANNMRCIQLAQNILHNPLQAYNDLLHLNILAS